MMREQKNNFLQEMALSSMKRLEKNKANKSEEDLLRICEGIKRKPPLEFQSGFIFITEIKKTSPSLGEISKPEFNLFEQAETYVNNGSNVISVLTEPSKFSGSLQDLNDISKTFSGTPTMRKDFLVEPYQVSEAFVNGAGGVLLILAMLTGSMLRMMIERAIKHEMFVLLEAFDEEDIQRAKTIISEFSPYSLNILLGVNCRDLRTLNINFSRFENLSSLIPEDVICIAESGITRPSEIEFISKLGYSGALIGTALMQSETPDQLLKEMMAASSEK
tara:strand:- start:694 stop:1521 length:828 start_codon:yes stop_codon:yes gene_type:complete